LRFYTTVLLSLAILGSGTEIGPFLYYVMLPKVTKATILLVAVAGIIVIVFTNGNTALRLLYEDNFEPRKLQKQSQYKKK
jgi:hypothetical protein